MEQGMAFGRVGYKVLYGVIGTGNMNTKKQMRLG